MAGGVRDPLDACTWHVHCAGGGLSAWMIRGHRAVQISPGPTTRSPSGGASRTMNASSMPVVMTTWSHIRPDRTSRLTHHARQDASTLIRGDPFSDPGNATHRQRPHQSQPPQLRARPERGAGSYHGPDRSRSCSRTGGSTLVVSNIPRLPSDRDPTQIRPTRDMPSPQMTTRKALTPSGVRPSATWSPP